LHPKAIPEKTEYAYNGSGITETHYTGTLVDTLTADDASSGGPDCQDRLTTLQGPPILHALSDTINYQPRLGLEYMWSEGQSQVLTNRHHVREEQLQTW